MPIEELAWSVAIDTDVGIQAQNFTTPDIGVVKTSNKLLEAGLRPKHSSKGRVMDLKAIVDADGFAAFGLARGGGQGEGGEKGRVGSAKSCGEEVWNEKDLIGEECR